MPRVIGGGVVGLGGSIAYESPSPPGVGMFCFLSKLEYIPTPAVRSHVSIISSLI